MVTRETNLNLLESRRRILLNTPHIESKSSLSPLSFSTDVVTGLKECKVHFSPIQEGTGTPSPENVRAIKGWDGIEVTRCGKNLCDISESNFHDSQRCNLEYSNVGVVLTATGQYARARYITNVEKGKTYTVSLYVSSTGDYNMIYLGNNKGSWAYPQHGTFEVNSSREFYKRTFVALTDVFTIGFYCTAQGNTGIMTADNIQLEEGSTATPYEPYQGESYDIDFPQSAGTVYGGTLDVTTGLLTVTMAEVDLGTIDWNYYTGSASPYFTSRRALSPAYLFKIKNINILCSNYSYAGVGSIGSDIGFSVIETSYIRLRDLNYTDAATFKAAMSGVQLVYELATPITYQLTPHTIRTLKGINNVFSNANGNIDVKFYSH